MRQNNISISVKYINEIQATLELIISNRHLFTEGKQVKARDFACEWDEFITGFDHIRSYLKSTNTTMANLRKNLRQHYDKLIEQRNDLCKILESKKRVSRTSKQNVSEILQDTKSFLNSYIHEIPSVSKIIKCNKSIISLLSD